MSIANRKIQAFRGVAFQPPLGTAEICHDPVGNRTSADGIVFRHVCGTVKSRAASAQSVLARQGDLDRQFLV